jgi:predicted esterase
MHHPIPEHDTLRKAFPHAKFVFPSAQFLRAKDFDRIPITQWFDLVGKGKHRDANPGEIGASCQYLFTLMQRAIAEVGAENVIVGGWSQGCAVSLFTMLLWEGPPIAAFVGMSGRLQYKHTFVKEIVAGDGVSDDPGKAIAWLRAILLGRQSSGLSYSPRKLSAVYLGHGAMDKQIAIEQARESSEMLTRLGAEVHFREYGELGHGFNGEMLKDIVEFVRQRLPARDAGKDTKVRSAL